jgi:hypothetical protein
MFLEQDLTPGSVLPELAEPEARQCGDAEQRRVLVTPCGYERAPRSRPGQGLRSRLSGAASSRNALDRYRLSHGKSQSALVASLVA